IRWKKRHRQRELRFVSLDDRLSRVARHGRSPRGLSGRGDGPPAQGSEPVKTIAHTFLLVMVTALSHEGRALAHHSFAAEFDAEKPVTLKGTVVKWEMMNPHGWITIDVTKSDGKTVQW